MTWETSSGTYADCRSHKHASKHQYFRFLSAGALLMPPVYVRTYLPCSTWNIVRTMDSRYPTSYNWLIFAKNSLFDPALASRSINNSIASTGDKGFSTLRSTQMRCKSSFGISSSSLRVPER